MSRRSNLLFLLTLAFGIPSPRATAQGPVSPPEPPPVRRELILPTEATTREPAGEAREQRSEEAIETDRDSFTPSTRTVGRSRLVLESAYSFLENRHRPETHSFPELLVRYGLSERVELRLGYNYEVGGGGNTISGVEGAEGPDVAGIEREHRALYGLKVLLTEQDGAVPVSSFLVQGFTPLSGKATDTQLLAGYVFGWELSNGWKLDAAVRYQSGSEEDDRFDVWAPSVVVRVPMGERINLHAEYFGLFSRGKHADFVQHYFSPGIHYLVTPDLEVGIRLGWGLNDQSTRFFTNVGFGWRF